MGCHHTSNTYRVDTADGNVIKARAVLRMPMPDRWCAGSVKSIAPAPWSPRVVTAPGVIGLGPSVENPVG